MNIDKSDNLLRSKNVAGIYWAVFTSINLYSSFYSASRHCFKACFSWRRKKLQVVIVWWLRTHTACDQRTLNTALYLVNWKNHFLFHFQSINPTRLRRISFTMIRLFYTCAILVVKSWKNENDVRVLSKILHGHPKSPISTQ